MKMTLSSKIKTAFEKIDKKADKKTEIYLNRTGAYLMRTMRSTIGKGNKKPRKPGKPMSFRKEAFVYRNKKTGKYVSRYRMAEMMTTRKKSIHQRLKKDKQGEYAKRAKALSEADLQGFYTKVPRRSGGVKKGIKFEVNLSQKEVLVGATGRGALKDIYKAHESGGAFRGVKYPKRSFIKASLKKAKTKPGFKNIFKNTIGKI